MSIQDVQPTHISRRYGGEEQMESQNNVDYFDETKQRALNYDLTRGP